MTERGKYIKKAFTLAEGATHVDMLPTVAKFGFTLAETLITLGIVGVVAAITIPGLMQAHKAHRLRSQFLKSYSIIQQAFRQMEADDLSLDPSTYDLGEFYKTFGNYVKFTTDCGRFGSNMKNIPICFYKAQGFNAETTTTGYKTFDGNKIFNDAYLDDGQLVLLDGTNLLFENALSGRVFVSVDLNGYNTPPNKAGYDLFTFELKEGELKTIGSTGTSYDINTYCNENTSDNLNGIACAHRAKTETDYFKRVVKNVK